MTYRIEPSSDVRPALFAVAHDQADRAIDALEDWEDDTVEAVHECRKRCKKLRGLVRLFRPSLGEHYTAANRTFRDAARELGPTRDAHALANTFDTLVRAHQGTIDRDVVRPVGEALRRRSDDATAALLADPTPVRRALDLLDDGRRSIEEWDLDGPLEDGFDVMAGGLGKSYGRGYEALSDALGSPTAPHFHEYRKRTKYTRYHVSLLRDVAPSVTKPLIDALHDLSDALGDAHDLSVLTRTLDDEAGFGGPRAVSAARLLIDGQRADLRRRAVSLGSRLHAEEPDAFVKRFGEYWHAALDHGPELSVGGIEALAAR